MVKVLKRDVARLEKDIDAVMDRIVEASSDAAVPAYEKKIARLEQQRLMKADQLKNGTRPRHTWEELFEPAMIFLASPWKI
ncbi:MAG: hypothetical protein AAF416_16640 [Pseudomonadota bacterium]